MRRGGESPLTHKAEDKEEEQDIIPSWEKIYESHNLDSKET